MLGLLSGGLLSWVKIGVIAVAIAAVGAGYWHYTSLLSERARLAERVHVQETALEDWSRRWTELRVALTEVEKLRREAREYHDELQELLAKHDLNKLALEKPYLIQRRATSATAARFRMLECITGRTAACEADQSATD